MISGIFSKKQNYKASAESQWKENEFLRKELWKKFRIVEELQLMGFRMRTIVICVCIFSLDGAVKFSTIIIHTEKPIETIRCGVSP